MCATWSVWWTEKNPILRTVLRRLAVFSSLGVLLFACLQWLLDSPLLAIYFYSALPIGLCTVSLAFAAAVVVGRAPAKRIELIALGTAGLVVGSTALGSKFGSPFLAIIVASLLAVVAVLFQVRRSSARLWMSVVGLLFVATWATVSSPHDFPASPGGYRSDPAYDDVLFAYEPSSMDRVKIVHELSRALPSLPDERGELKVWFDSRGPFDQLTAPFLWYRSALQSPVDEPMPEVSATVRERILISRPRFILIIDGQEEDALQGIGEVTTLAPYSVVWKRVIASGSTEAHVALLERDPGTWLDFPCESPGSLAPVVCA